MSSLFQGFSFIIKFGKLVNVQQILNNPHPITELNNLLASEDSRINFLSKRKTRSKYVDTEPYLTLVITARSQFCLLLALAKLSIPCYACIKFQYFKKMLTYNSS